MRRTLAVAVCVALAILGVDEAGAAPSLSVEHRNHHSSTGTSSSAGSYDASGRLSLSGAATERWPVTLLVGFDPVVPTRNVSFGFGYATARFQRSVEPGDYVARFVFTDVTATESAVQRGVSVLSGNTSAAAFVALGADSYGGACNNEGCEFEDFDIDRVDFDCPSNCSLGELVLSVRVTVPDLPNQFLDVHANVDVSAFAAADGEASASFVGTLQEFSVERVDAV